MATAHDATRARLRFDTVIRSEAHHRGTGKPAQKALHAISSSREVAAWASAIDALGTISSALMAYEPNIADQIRERRAGTDIVGVIALTPERHARLSAPHDRRSSEPAAGE